ncbi:hypothetical protein PATA110616_09590 [Paenibacillus tarimensis]
MLMCPVCNGLRSIATSCPNGHGSLDDAGRPSDWSGPYAPYVPDRYEAWNNRDLDNASHTVCVHIAQCNKCGYMCQVAVSEWNC